MNEAFEDKLKELKLAFTGEPVFGITAAAIQSAYRDASTGCGCGGCGGGCSGCSSAAACTAKV